MITDTLYQSPVIFDYLPDPAVVAAVPGTHNIIYLTAEGISKTLITGDALLRTGIYDETISLSILDSVPTLVDSRGPYS